MSTSLRLLLSRALTLLLPLSIASTIYLYLYPIFHGCAFPIPVNNNNGSTTASSQLPPPFNALLSTLLQHIPTTTTTTWKNRNEPEPAIFRLLVLADPQLEGDSSLPFKEYELVPRIKHHWTNVRSSIAASPSSSVSILSDPDVLSNVTTALRELLVDDIPREFRSMRKRLDLLGNDCYLAHIYRTLRWWSRPTHATVLGDLVGSQWVTDEEFYRRASRFWGRVFKGGKRVEDEITITGARGYKEQDQEVQLQDLPVGGSEWSRRIINIAGNHDIGYAGDISEARIERFERAFGRANWDVRFRLPPRRKGATAVAAAAAAEEEEVKGGAGSEGTTITPTLHIINLNSLTLDTPALSQEIQSASYDYINDIISRRSYPVEDRMSFTLLLTHLPLHKSEGICTDGPQFSFHESDDEEGDTDENGENPILRFREGGLKDQNHLSQHVSTTGILEGIFGMSGNDNAVAGGWGRNGLILTGHDHTGCDVIHFVDRSVEEPDEADPRPWKWDAKRYTTINNQSPVIPDTPFIREVTLRSMMGEYGGNAGLLSIWFDDDNDSGSGSGEWKYEIAMCRAGVQHIWWAVHVFSIVALIVLVAWMILAFVWGDIDILTSKTKTKTLTGNIANGAKKKNHHHHHQKKKQIHAQESDARKKINKNRNNGRQNGN
ncbi:hypothetical protein MAP00_005016 [Monascus purpureus]|nr:hypothetical protein MAP00_005016 [Monascus purpureus]